MKQFGAGLDQQAAIPQFPTDQGDVVDGAHDNQAGATRWDAMKPAVVTGLFGVTRRQGQLGRHWAIASSSNARAREAVAGALRSAASVSGFAPYPTIAASPR
jgi:hypothetical protein